MIYHVLNGDALAASFPDAGFSGEIVVVREGLVEGDLSGSTLQDFWESRARYMGLRYSDYEQRVVGEFEKMMHAPRESEFNLWFEYDLFCQVNMWFVVSLLDALPTAKTVFAVYSTHVNKHDKHFWNGFGPATTDELKTCYTKRRMLNDGDLHFAKDLWESYKNGDLKALKGYSEMESPAFPFMHEVIQAHIDRFSEEKEQGRPERVVEDIIRNVSTDFQEVFKEFWKRESIYGFGDLQVKQIYDNIMHKLGRQ